MNFKEYAQYYNLLYKNKNYENEVAYVDQLIKKYQSNDTIHLLDVGCGTGLHDDILDKMGYKVCGVDISENMIRLAKEHYPQIDFYPSSIQELNLNKNFDAVISLFHVMNYHQSNKDLNDAINNISNHLKKDGLFIFDFWYGPAVLSDHPQKKEVVLEDENISLIRKTEPVMRYNENTVDVHFHCKITKKETNDVSSFDETHRMRYLFLPELDHLLYSYGITILDSFKWLSDNEPLSDKSWYGVIIAQKRK